MSTTTPTPSAVDVSIEAQIATVTLNRPEVRNAIDDAMRAELIGIMRPRVEEILEEVRYRLDAAGFDHLPSQQIVLTGGASQIPGLDGLAARILGPNIRCGRPLRIDGLAHQFTDPGFSSAVGLALFAAHPQDEWWDFDMPVSSHGARSVRRVAATASGADPAISAASASAAGRKPSCGASTSTSPMECASSPPIRRPV